MFGDIFGYDNWVEALLIEARNTVKHTTMKRMASPNKEFSSIKFQ